MSLTGRTMCFHSHLPPIFKMCWSVRKPCEMNEFHILYEIKILCHGKCLNDFYSPGGMHLKSYLFTVLTCLFVFFMHHNSWLKIVGCTFHGITFKTPVTDQNSISLYNINTISSRQVMRIKKDINLEDCNQWFHDTSLEKIQ